MTCCTALLTQYPVFEPNGSVLSILCICFFLGDSHLQDYSILLTQLETLFHTSPSFTLQKAFFYLHPTIHTLSLLHQLTHALYLADDSIVPDDDGLGDEDESSEDEMAAALGLGGKKMKDLMKQMNGGEGAGEEGGGGLVVGGEVLSLIWNMRRGMSG